MEERRGALVGFRASASCPQLIGRASLRLRIVCAVGREARGTGALDLELDLFERAAPHLPTCRRGRRWGARRGGGRGAGAGASGGGRRRCDRSI
jgi:hypothetical protein